MTNTELAHHIVQLGFLLMALCWAGTAFVMWAIKDGFDRMYNSVFYKVDANCEKDRQLAAFLVVGAHVAALIQVVALLVCVLFCVAFIAFALVVEMVA